MPRSPQIIISTLIAVFGFISVGAQELSRTVSSPSGQAKPEFTEEQIQELGLPIGPDGQVIGEAADSEVML